jgi:hypothetical protein
LELQVDGDLPLDDYKGKKKEFAKKIRMSVMHQLFCPCFAHASLALRRAMQDYSSLSYALFHGEAIRSS